MADNIQKNYKSALAVAIRYLNHKDRTEYEITERLARDDYSEEVISQIISYLREQGYVNDKRYAEYYFVCYSAKRSRRRIENELLAKGIAQSVVDDIEASLDTMEENQREAVGHALKKQLLKRRIAQYEFATYEEKNAIKAALYRQGFSSEIIADVLRK